VEDLSSCGTIFAVKEVPARLLQKGKTYVFFSHTIKGQANNMPLLRAIMAAGCQLIDYEKMTDEKGRRLVFFGKYAGLAGMTDTLWALGQRLKWEKIPNPFSELKRALDYPNFPDAEKALDSVGKKIASGGLPEAVTPLVIGFTGYGHVSQGAQMVLKRLPVEEIKPEDLASLFRAAHGAKARDRIFKVVFREEHLVEPITHGQNFELQDYYQHPEKYRSRFEQYIPQLTALVNCIYWEAKYPRLVTKSYLKKLYGGAPQPRLRVIGDITCDTEGSVECNIKSMDPGNPVFVYDPLKGTAEDGYRGAGPVVLAVDNLPAELPIESSREFSEALLPFVPEISKADMSVKFEDCRLPEPVKKAVIVYQGKLTPGYRYLEKFL
jgi:alpha-aminoadipic semialdehyde synthase